MRTLISAAVLLFFIPVRTLAPGFETDFMVMEIEGTDYVEINSLLAVTGGSKSWDNISRRMELKMAEGSVIFTDGSPYLISDGEVLNLHFPVTLKQGVFFVPVHGIIGWMEKSGGPQLIWNRETGRLCKAATEEQQSVVDGVSIRRIGDTVQMRVSLTRSTPFKMENRGDLVLLNFPEAGSLPVSDMIPTPVPPILDISVETIDGSLLEFAVKTRKGTEPPKLVETVSPRGVLLIFNYERPSSIWDVLPMDEITPIKERIARREKFDTIVIDPGHGGIDPGCSGVSGTIEKIWSLELAFKVANILRNDYGLYVLITRTEDKYVSLKKRCEFANLNGADLFLSLHANSSVDTSLNGIQTFYYGAAREDETVGDNVFGILTEPETDSDVNTFPLKVEESQLEFVDASFEAANCISYVMGKMLDMQNLGISPESFFVLRGAAMPAVLVETGFLSCPEEEKYLTGRDTQNQIARAIAGGVAIFMNL